MTPRATRDSTNIGDAHPGDSGAESRRRLTKPVVVKPVVKAIQILRHLSRVPRPAKAVEIARALSINPSTCFNILRTLVMEGVVEFDERAKTYSAGIGLTRMVERFVSDAQRLQAARLLMQDVAAAQHVTLTLWRRVGDDRIVLVATEASPADLRITMSEGQRLPLLMGASGRLMAGHLGLDEKRVHEMFKTLRWARPLSFQTYWREVQRGLRRGYTVDDGYFTAGIRTVAAPILGSDGTVAYAISAVTLRGQLDNPGTDRLGQAMHALAARLANVLV